MKTDILCTQNLTEKNTNYQEEKNMVNQTNEKQDIKFSDVWNAFIEYKRKMVDGGIISEASFKRYEWLYNRCIKDTDLEQCNIEELTTAKLEEYILEMVKENELNKKAASNLLWGIRQVLKYAYDAALISNNLVDGLESEWIIKCVAYSERAKDSVSEMEVKAILEKIHEKEENSSNPIPYYAIELATITGMRANEVCALKWEDMFAMPNIDIKEILGHKEIKIIKRYGCKNCGKLNKYFI